MNKKCNECVACELTEYIKPYHIVYICHQGEMILGDLSLAEECKCFEQTNEKLIQEDEELKERFKKLLNKIANSMGVTVVTLDTTNYLDNNITQPIILELDKYLTKEEINKLEQTWTI